jgi:nicotinamidase/pyrazinamidase
MKKALLVVDVQRDFCQGGALAAVNTLSLLEPLDRVITSARLRGILIVFSQDWHPTTHSSFQSNGGPWPVHCVAGSPGAEIMPPLAITSKDILIRKGVSSTGDGYSVFEAPELAEELRAGQITSIGVAGIATEYCVRASALDATQEGFSAAILTDLIRAVDPNAAPAVLAELAASGLQMTTSEEWLSR